MANTINRTQKSNEAYQIPNNSVSALSRFDVFERRMLEKFQFSYFYAECKESILDEFYHARAIFNYFYKIKNNRLVASQYYNHGFDLKFRDNPEYMKRDYNKDNRLCRDVILLPPHILDIFYQLDVLKSHDFGEDRLNNYYNDGHGIKISKEENVFFQFTKEGKAMLKILNKKYCDGLTKPELASMHTVAARYIMLGRWY